MASSSPSEGIMSGAVETVAAMANGLTTARRAMILALPADGSWGKVPSRNVAKRAWWSIRPNLLEHKHLPEDANEWALSDTGIAIRAHLDAQQESTS